MTITAYYTVPELTEGVTADAEDFNRWLISQDITLLAGSPNEGIKLRAPEGTQLQAHPGDMLLVDDGLLRFATIAEQEQIEAETTPPEPLDYELVYVRTDQMTEDRALVTADVVEIHEGFVFFRLRGTLVLAIPSSRVLEFCVDGAQEGNIRNPGQEALVPLSNFPRVEPGSNKGNPFAL